MHLIGSRLKVCGFPFAVQTLFLSRFYPRDAFVFASHSPLVTSHCLTLTSFAKNIAKHRKKGATDAHHRPS